mmetsp:Transcript_28381/g.61080  ORF Transcript_28381/g.61080 Transcript_28381/m.61080 type:complete len:96 (+) Transcript_28381:2571-2858(+)
MLLLPIFVVVTAGREKAPTTVCECDCDCECLVDIIDHTQQIAKAINIRRLDPAPGITSTLIVAGLDWTGLDVFFCLIAIPFSCMYGMLSTLNYLC